MLDYFKARLTDPDWWFDEAASFIIFTLLAGAISGWVSSWLQTRAERRARAPYEGWKLIVVGFGDPPDFEEPAEDLYWEDVKRYRNSEFELWKWVKSICSGACIVTARSARMARRQGWLTDEPKRIVIDFTKMKEDEVSDWKVARKWLGEVAPPMRPASGHGPR